MKRLAFVFAICALVATVAELFAFSAISFRDGERFQWKRFQQVRQGLAKVAPGRRASDTVIHPYLGFVLRPPSVLQTDASGSMREEWVSDWGFPYTRESPIQKRDPAHLVIAIVGGSVAANFYELGREELERALRDADALGERELVFVNLASFGYKQPQQLIAVTYHYSLGAEFDYVINIDGFNEVALHSSENGLKNVFPAFPRNWYGVAGGLANRDAGALAAQAAEVAEQRRTLARTFSRAPWRYSPSANLVWEFLDGRRERARVELEERFRSLEPATGDYAVTGPDPGFSFGRSADAFLVETWKRSSILLDRLCRANGTRYLHVLQPNQYVLGSKPLSRAERRTAYHPDHPYRRSIEEGYGPLRSGGDELLGEGVKFLDLSEIFLDRTDTLYVDTCCHFNRAGNEMLAREIALAVAGDLAG